MCVDKMSDPAGEPSAGSNCWRLARTMHDDIAVRALLDYGRLTLSIVLGLFALYVLMCNAYLAVRYHFRRGPSLIPIIGSLSGMASVGIYPFRFNIRPIVYGWILLAVIWCVPPAIGVVGLVHRWRHPK